MMRQFFKTILLLASIALLAPKAWAITLTSHDGVEQKILIIEGDKQTDRVIKPQEKIEICPQSCVIRMGNGEDYEFDGSEVVLIEDGLLILDVPEDQTKPNR